MIRDSWLPPDCVLYGSAQEELDRLQTIANSALSSSGEMRHVHYGVRD